MYQEVEEKGQGKWKRQQLDAETQEKFNVLRAKQFKRGNGVSMKRLIVCGKMGESYQKIVRETLF